MPIGTTIDGLNAVTSLTTNDEVPVWDKEASGEPTKKITAQNLASSVKTLADLQGALTFDSTPTAGSTNPVTSGGIADAIAQSTASIHIVNSGTVTLTCNAMGTQIDANNIICVANLPFITANSNYTVSDINAVILLVGTATATVDSKGPSTIRFNVPHSGTIRDAYIVSISFTITL